MNRHAITSAGPSGRQHQSWPLTSRTRPSDTCIRLLSVAALGLIIAGCTPRLPPSSPTITATATPAPGTVESVLYLVGDPGEAIPGRSALMARLTEDVEEWSAALQPASVRVAYLGDLVYPVGVRPIGTPEHAQDTLALRAQLNVILGSAAHAAGTELLFIPGNHDWGNDIGTKGAERLSHMQARIDRWAALGHPVRMVPTNADIGPVTVPLSDDVQAVILDTQAWLAGAPADQSRAGQALSDVLGRTGQTSIVLAHHPLVSGGNHGARTLDDPFALLLGRAIPQDLPSTIYQRMKTQIEDAFQASTPPLLYAAGHDHNLQLFTTDEPSREAEWTLISGSASKLTAVSDTPGMIFGGPWPGFGRVFVLRDGRIILQVVAGQAESQLCDQLDRDALARCMFAQTQAFRTIFSETLRGPR